MSTIPLPVLNGSHNAATTNGARSAHGRRLSPLESDAPEPAPADFDAASDAVSSAAKRPPASDTDPLPPLSSRPTPTFPAGIENQLLRALSQATLSIAELADEFEISMVDLAAWWHSPRIQEYVEVVERFADERDRFSARLSRNVAIDTLTKILHRTRSYDGISYRNVLTFTNSLRAHETGRRAAGALVKLAGAPDQPSRQAPSAVLSDPNPSDGQTPAIAPHTRSGPGAASAPPHTRASGIEPADLASAAGAAIAPSALVFDPTRLSPTKPVSMPSPTSPQPEPIAAHLLSARSNLNGCVDPFLDDFGPSAIYLRSPHAADVREDRIDKTRKNL